MKSLPIPTPNGNPASTCSDACTSVLQSFLEYKKISEGEKTKREYIQAHRDVALARIQSHRETLEKYLTETFAERRLVISQMFDALDKGIETGNDQVIGMAMQSIVETIKVSPLQGVQTVMNQIEDPNVDFIEI